MRNGYEVGVKDEYQHRILAERAIGRELISDECVHHVDGNPLNNDPSNLVVCPNQKYHMLLHARQRIVDLGGCPDTEKYCSYHKTLHSREEFSTRPSSHDGLHNMCRSATNQYRKAKGLNRNKFNWRERLNQQYRRAFKNTRVMICQL